MLGQKDCLKRKCLVIIHKCGLSQEFNARTKGIRTLINAILAQIALSEAKNTV